MTPWREPAEESLDLYPNLVVSDDRINGSITVGRSRLPLWAIIHSAINMGWEDVEEGWSPTEHYGYGPHDIADFLYNLLEMRGEFARLLLVLADAERDEREREDKVLSEAAPEGGLVEISPWKEDSVKLPPAWWEYEPSRQKVIEQLKRCLSALESD